MGNWAQLTLGGCSGLKGVPQNSCPLESQDEPYLETAPLQMYRREGWKGDHRDEGGPKSSDRVLRKGHTGRRPCDGVKAETGVTQLQTEDAEALKKLEEAGRAPPLERSWPC